MPWIVFTEPSSCLACQVDLAAVDDHGETALHLAIRGGSVDWCEITFAVVHSDLPMHKYSLKYITTQRALSAITRGLHTSARCKLQQRRR